MLFSQLIIELGVLPDKVHLLSHQEISELFDAKPAQAEHF